MALQKRHVVFWSHALEGHAQKVLVGLQDALCHSESLYVAHAVDAAYHLHHAVVYADWILVAAVIRQYVVNLDMASESYHLVADGVLES